MSDSESTPRRGRRARALTPEESAALESRTASMVTGETSPIPGVRGPVAAPEADAPVPKDRKSTRLNSSHVAISYAVFCLKKKKYYKYIFILLTHISNIKKLTIYKH